MTNESLESLEGSEIGEPGLAGHEGKPARVERPEAKPEPRPVEELTADELRLQGYRALMAGDMAGRDACRDELHRRESRGSALARFGEPPPGSFHGDERTGDGIGDDERSQREWRDANPVKVRSRERRATP